MEEAQVMPKPICRRYFRMALWGVAAWIAASAIRALRVPPQASSKASRSQAGLRGIWQLHNSSESLWSDGWSN
jgi:hypothetical protein